MEATLIVDDPELALVLSGNSLINFGRMEDWVGLAARGDGRSVGMTNTGNQTRIARMNIGLHTIL